MSLARLGLVPLLGFLPLLGFGCSDPVPPTPRGAFLLTFIDPGASCNTAGHVSDLGSVTSSRKDRVVVDGQENASVSCRVSGSGSFTVEADARNGDTATRIGFIINNISPSATQDAPATGSITYASFQTGGEPFNADPERPCRFWFNANTGQGVGEGKVWFSFECPAVVNDSYTCQITQGAAIFENCET